MRKRWNQVTTRFTVLLSVIILLLGSVFVTVVSNINRSARETFYNGIERAEAIYQADFTASLDTVRLLLNDIYTDFDNLSNLGSQDQKTDYLARYELMQKMEQRLQNSSDLDGIFILYGEDMMLRKYSYRVSYTEWLDIYDDIQKIGWKLPANRVLESESVIWNCVKLGSNWYLVNACDAGNCRIIALVSIDNLFELLEQSHEMEGGYLLVNEENQVLLTSGDSLPLTLENLAGQTLPDLSQQQILTVEKEMGAGGLRLIFCMDNHQLRLDLSRFSLILPFFLLLVLVSVAILIVFIRKNVLQPVSDMLKAVNEIEKGNMHWQIPHQKRLEEFDRLTNEFNSMVGEVLRLRIEGYEQQLNLQKANLRYLQMQIRPHFYLNALTTIHSMTIQKRDEDIRKYIDMLSTHIRYMLYGSMAMTRIGDELEHIRNFVEMKELCFPDCVFYMDDIASADLLDYQMPKLMALTVVENSFKYAMRLYQPMNLLIRLDLYSENQMQFVRLIIEDDGEGYPQQLIDDFEQYTASEKGVGLTNVRDTFRLCYNRDGLVRISRAIPNGARTELLIPLEDADRHNQK